MPSRPTPRTSGSTRVSSRFANTTSTAQINVAATMSVSPVPQVTPVGGGIRRWPSLRDGQLVADPFCSVVIQALDDSAESHEDPVTDRQIGKYEHRRTPAAAFALDHDGVAVALYDPAGKVEAHRAQTCPSMTARNSGG